MKRKFFLYGLLLFIIVGGIPYFTGQLVETRFNELSEAISDNPDISLKTISYERHWRKSYARTRVTLKGGFLKKLLAELGEEIGQSATNVDLNRPISVIFDHEIRHGPFVQLQEGNYKDWEFAQAIIHSKLFLNEEARSLLEKELEDADFIAIRSEISIDGEITISLEGKPIQISENGVKQDIWQGIKGEWQIDRTFNKIVGQMEFPGFNFDITGAKYKAKNLKFKTTATHSKENRIWYSKGKFTAESVEINQVAKPTVFLNRILLNANTQRSVKENGPLLDSIIQVSIKNIKVDNKEYGPLKYKMTLGRLSPSSFKAIKTITNDIGVRVKNPIEQIDKWQKILPDILKTGPIFSIENLMLETQKGPVTGALYFRIGGSQASDLNRLDIVLNSIAAKAQLKLPDLLLKELLHTYFDNAIRAEYQKQGLSFEEETLQKEIISEIERTILFWQKQNYIIQQDENYSIELSLDSGNLRLNQQPIALPKI